MKIGFEYEGVILDEDNKIVRWTKIPLKRQFRIKTKMDMMDVKQDPIDTYDCLAEVRTEPLENKTPRELVVALRDAIQTADRAFSSEGYSIFWGEMRVPKSLHNEILAHIEFTKEFKKETRTLDHGCDQHYESEGNVWRGGGLHVNVSPMPKPMVTAMAVNLHTVLHDLIDNWALNSNYRNNLLWRHREVRDKEGVVTDKIGEYMSFGFNLEDVGPLDIWEEASSHWSSYYPIQWMTKIHNELMLLVHGEDNTEWVDHETTEAYLRLKKAEVEVLQDA